MITSKAFKRACIGLAFAAGIPLAGLISVAGLTLVNHQAELAKGCVRDRSIPGEAVQFNAALLAPIAPVIWTSHQCRYGYKPK